MKRRSEFDFSREAKVLLFDTECFRGDVEILTEEGFIRFDQLGDEKVAQYHEDGSIDFVKPIRKIKKQYSGDGVEFFTRRGSIVTTANHTMVSRDPKTGKIKRSLAKDFACGGSNRTIYAGLNLTTKKMSALDKLALALQADGHLNYVREKIRGKGKGVTWGYWTLFLRKKRKVERLKDILSETDLSWTSGKVRRKNGKEDFWFSIYAPKEMSKNLRSWFELKDCGEDFLRELALWDGCSREYRGGVQLSYNSCNFDNILFVQAVATCCGRIATWCVSDKKALFDKRRTPCYKLTMGFTFTGDERTFGHKNVKMNETVYCVEVPSHLILVRGGQQTLVVGNCSPTLSWNYGQYESNAVKVEKPPVLLSVAWKWLGDAKTECLTIADNPLEDRFDCSLVVDKLWHLLDEANIAIAHNINFDIKLATAFFLRQGLTPPSPYKTFCTLQAARRYFRTDNNKLDYLGELLGVGRKEKVTNADVWYDVLFGDGQLRKKQNKLLRKYNIQDVELLEKIYLKLRPWATNHPNLALLSGHTDCCPRCGCAKGFRIRAYRRTGTQINGIQYSCDNCHSYVTRKLDKEEREALESEGKLKTVFRNLPA